MYKNNNVKIENLKEMLEKSGKLYGDKQAYKIKIDKEKYITYTHVEIREKNKCFGNCTNKFRS